MSDHSLYFSTHRIWQITSNHTQGVIEILKDAPKGLSCLIRESTNFVNYVPDM